MITILQFLIQSIPIFLSIAVPGVLLSLAILRKTNLHLFEIFFVGIVLGISVPSLMGFSEFLIGIPFSLGLHLINLVIVCLLSIGIIIKDKIEILPKTKLNIKILYAFLTLTIVLFLAWWIRQQAISPYFYEFDPYWYNTITELIINQGGVPVYTNNAWWPQEYSYRTFNLIQYAEAGWYYIFSATNGITQFDFTTMTLVSSLYPAMAAALMCFFAYLWLSKEYGKAVGILAAGFLAFTPILVDKTLAGEFEMQPFGLMAIICFFAFYAITLKTSSKRFAIMAAFAIIISLLSSGAGRLPVYLLIGVSSIIGIIKLFKNELKLDFVYLNLIISLGVIFGILLFMVYLYPISGITSISLLVMVIGFLIFLYVLYYLQHITKNTDEKILYLSSILVVGLVLLIVTPLGGVLSEIGNLFLGVTTYADPTFQTIAEQTVTGVGLHSALGLFGTDIAEFSIVTVILVLAAIPLIFSLIFEISTYSLLGLVGVLPMAITGLFKIKYSPYSGLFVPLLICIALGEICKNKSLKEYRKYIIGFFAILLMIQALNYYDVSLTSINVSTNTDFTSNIAIADVCNSKYQEIMGVANSNISKKFNDTGEMLGAYLLAIPSIKDLAISAKYNTQRTYCNRIPDHWLNAMYWLKNNTLVDDRTICWWDYGHWITTFGQRKSVTDNTHAFTMMHQEVADKLVYNTPEALIEYMLEHKAKYLLLDEDLIGGIGRSDSLIGKWGALVYHACYFNNKTDIKNGPGVSDCDKENYPEILYIPLPDQQFSLSSEHVCNNLINGKKAVKIYSPYFEQKYKFDYYCMPLDSLNELIGTLQYKLNYDGIGHVPISVKYENGKDAGINNGLFRSVTSDNYLVFIATYPSDNPDRKGKFYDSVFYKGFFEGNIQGFEQVHPSYNANSPNIPVRIFKLK